MFRMLLLFCMIVFCTSFADAAIDKQKSYNDSLYEQNLDENSFQVSDEQFQDVQNNQPFEEKQSFSAKVINSSHFSSGTATQTWVPLNRKK